MAITKEKKTSLTRDSSTAKAGKVKQKAAGFANWIYEYVSTKDGSTKELKSNRGFAIFTEGKYIDAKEVWLIDAAKKAAARGEKYLDIKVTMRIVLNESEDLSELPDI